MGRGSFVLMAIPWLLALQFSTQSGHILKLNAR